jgi:hypothetical protein
MIEGRRGAIVRPAFPRIPIALPFSGKVLAPVAPNLGTGTH